MTPVYGRVNFCETARNQPRLWENRHPAPSLRQISWTALGSTKSLSSNHLRILWVKAGKLLPVDTGGKIRSYNILRHLARAHTVTLLSYYGGHADRNYEDEIRRELPGAETIHTAALDGTTVAQFVDYAWRFFRWPPFAVSKFTHGKVRRVVSSRIAGGNFDVAVCDFLSASLNFPETLTTPAVLFQHNVETALWQRMAETELNPAKRAIDAARQRLG